MIELDRRDLADLVTIVIDQGFARQRPRVDMGKRILGLARVRIVGDSDVGDIDLLQLVFHFRQLSDT